MTRHLQRWAAHRKDTMPQAMAATSRCSIRSFGKQPPIHYFSVQVQLARDRSQYQWLAEGWNPKTCSTRPVRYSTFFRTISMPLFRSGVQAWAHHHRQWQQRHFLKTASRDRKRLAHSTRTFETSSNRANHSGLRKPPMQPAVETPGRRLFWTPSDILFNMQASPSMA